MRNVQSILLWILVLPLATLVVSSAHGQALKIGYVDDEQITQNYPAWQRAQEQWELENKAWDDEATSKQEELQEMLDEYDKQKLILSEEKRKEREAQIRVKREALDAYTNQIYGPGGTAERKHKELVQPLQKNITEAIRLLAEEEGYDVIFTSMSGLGYIRETYDVTEKVLEYLDKVEE
jgi:outer membrane protein